MSGNHGIAFRLMGGVSYFSAYFDVNIFVGQFTEQLLQYGVKWMIVNLSSPSSGDRHLSPHSVLTHLKRGPTSKVVPVGEWGSEDVILDNLEDRD